MKCQIFASKSSGQVLTGTVYLRGGKVSGVAASPEYQTAIDDTMRTAHGVKGKAATATSDPEGWFRALPQQYHGTYVRALMVKDDAGDPAAKTDFGAILIS